jgi:uncharacterized protein YgbK (DUF1537 family)
MTRLLIIADDLTGATETGVQFVRRGVPVLVTLNALGAGRGCSLEDSPVVAVDTETRRASPSAAAQRVRSVVGAALGGGFTHFYKKTDSTLRGNIGAELAAFMAATGHGRLVFVPAYPRAGRYTQGGRQFVGQQPLHESAIALDPWDPVTTSSVAEIIARQADLSVVSVAVDALGAALDREQAGVVVCDAASDADLDEITAILERHHALRCIAGPAGLAWPLADRLDLPRAAVAAPSLHSPLLIVNGSLHERSISQVAYALERGAYGLPVCPELALSEASDELAPMLGAHARPGTDVVTHGADRRRHADYLQLGIERGLSWSRHRRISEKLALIGAVVACGLPNPVPCAFGGDVAIALLRALGCDGLRPLAEGPPGVVLSLMLGGRSERYLVTKPGGFGDDRIVDDMRVFVGGAARAASPGGTAE